MTNHHRGFTYPTESFGRIPAFYSIDEEAEFWDTHDVSEFLGIEFQAVESRDEPEITDRLIIPLDPADREELRRQAKAHGLPPATLVRLWIEERLRHRAS
jgi:hypothetical protein